MSAGNIITTPRRSLIYLSFKFRYLVLSVLSINNYQGIVYETILIQQNCTMLSIHNQFQVIANDMILSIDQMHSIYGSFQIKRNNTCPPFWTMAWPTLANPFPKGNVSKSRGRGENNSIQTVRISLHHKFYTLINGVLWHQVLNHHISYKIGRSI